LGILCDHAQRFVRIVSQQRYPNPVPPSQAVQRLAEASNDEHHGYWPCSESLLDPSVIDHSMLLGSRKVADAYLLALATDRGGRLVTSDQTIGLRSVHGARPANLAII
jgi:predicted nucleic acid-binding protein